MLANHAPASNDSPQGDSDYETILTALMQTARGRSFLQEYALRNRTADTATLLTAIGQIEGLLKARILEPVEPLPDNANQAPETVEASPIEAMIAATAGPEIDPTPEVAQAATVSIEVAQVEIVSADAAEIDSFSVAVAELQGSAIEFLGPQSTGTGAAPAEPAPPPERTKHTPRDPFADFRALSNEEKIAIFT